MSGEVCLALSSQPRGEEIALDPAHRIWIWNGQIEDRRGLWEILSRLASAARGKPEAESTGAVELEDALRRPSLCDPRLSES